MAKSFQSNNVVWEGCDRMSLIWCVNAANFVRCKCFNSIDRPDTRLNIGLAVVRYDGILAFVDSSIIPADAELSFAST